MRKGTTEEIPEPVFSIGDTYIVDAGNRIWIWIGKDSTVDEQFTGAFIGDLMDKEREGEPDVETVWQGYEPPEFRQSVGAMRIVNKDLAKSILQKIPRTEREVVMYQVSSEEYETLNDIQFIQVPLSRDSLNSDDVFLIDTYDTVFVWQGKNCNVKEKVIAGRIARKFDAERVGVQEEVFIEEGEEPEKLRELLGL